MDLPIKRKTDKLNLATMFIIIAQLVAILWFVSKLDSRVETNTAWRKNNKAIPTLVIRIEERVGNILNKIDRLDEKIDKMFEKNRHE